MLEALRAVLRRWKAGWIADDPWPEYSRLDRLDGLERPQIPESTEVEEHAKAKEDEG